MDRFDISLLPPRTAPPEPVRFLLVLAAFGAIRALAFCESDPVGGAESAFLALLAGGVLASLAVLARSPGRELGAAAILVSGAVWSVGYGPHRGAVVTAILLGSLAVAVGRSDAGVWSTPGRSVALALGAQLIARSDLLLPPLLDLRTLVSVLALPAAAGLSLFLLSRRFGAGPVWVAGVAVFVLSPGFNVTVTLALVSLAAAALLADGTRAPMARALAVLALVVPLVWDPALGALFVLAALTFLLDGRASWLLSTAGISILVFVPPERLGVELLTFSSQALVLIPAVLAAPREGRHLVVRGAFLGLVAAMLGGGPEVLAGGVALAAMGLPRTGPYAAFQKSWIGVLGLGTTALAAYPWTREHPLGSFLELLGLGAPELALGAAILLVAGGGALGALWSQAGGGRPAAGGLVTAAVGFALFAAVPKTALVPIAYSPVVVDAERPIWAHQFSSREVSAGILDCHLVHGAHIALGTPVASVRLRGEGQELLGSWDLLAGFDTAEWAAARPDVAGIRGFRAPEPWLVQIAPGGGFFSQRFRARFFAEEGLEAATVAVRRHPDLPQDVALTIYRLELRR